jgi:hypothetical protein
VLSEDVDSEDEELQERYKRQKFRELLDGKYAKRVGSWNRGFGCPFCNHMIHPEYGSVLTHARG